MSDENLGPPLFRKLNSALGEKVPGYQMVRTTGARIENPVDLLLPFQLAGQLDEEMRAAVAQRAAEVDKVASEGLPSPQSTNSPPRRDIKNHVEVEHIAAHCTPPQSDRVYVSLWSQGRLEEAVERHNSCVGSSDAADRQRDAAVLRHMVQSGSWRRCSAPRDIGSCVLQLHQELPHWPDLLRLVEDHLNLAGADRPFSLPPILLVGPPGVGKTHTSRRLAELLMLPFKAVDLAVGQTNSSLHGSDRHWGNARPGMLFDLLVMGTHANPVVLLDEIDKTSSSDGRHNPLTPLFSALEPTTSIRSRDQCMDFEFDASRVIYLATANSLKGIPDPLLSRFHLVHAVEPDLRASLGIARAIFRRVLEERQLNDFEEAPDRLLLELADRSPRLIRKALELAVARAAAAGRARVDQSDFGASSGRAHLH